MPPKLLDAVRRQLIERGLARGYVMRLLDELTDHFRSSYEHYIAGGAAPADAARWAEADLGNVDAIIREVDSRPALLPFACRRPILSFVAGPIIILALAVGVFYLIQCGILMGATRALNMKSTDPVLRRVFLGAYDLFAYGFTPLLALLFCFTAHRRRRSPLWSLCACSALSLSGGLVQTWLVLCPGTGGVFFLSRFGVDLARLLAPVAVFVVFAMVIRRLQFRHWTATT